MTVHDSHQLGERRYRTVHQVPSHDDMTRRSQLIDYESVQCAAEFLGFPDGNAAIVASRSHS